MPLETSTTVPFPRPVVWDYHARPASAERLLPGFVPLEVLRADADLALGQISFSLPAGLRWTNSYDLTAYQRGRSFAEVNTSAPFQSLTRWRFEHRFADEPGGTLVADSVSSRIPTAALERVLSYRHRQLAGDLRCLKDLGFLEHGAAGGAPRVALTGAGGTLGRAFSALARVAGCEVIRLVRVDSSDTRHAPELSEGERAWDPRYPADDLLDDVDALVHLAGKPFFQRLTDAHRREVYDTRVRPTRLLAEVAARSPRCETLVSASSAGFYGDERAGERLAEDAAPGESFLARLAIDWEAATRPAAEAGVRVVTPRFGAVLAAGGGSLPTLRAAGALGGRAQAALGEQAIAWVSLDDAADILLRCVVDGRLEGPVNATAPTPGALGELLNTVASARPIPLPIPIPEFSPGALKGRAAAREFLFSDQRVFPDALERVGHRFRHRDVAGALAHEMGLELPGAARPGLPGTGPGVDSAP